MARPQVWLLIVIYLGFISLGLPDGTLGVAWPNLHRDLQLPVGLAGTLILIATLLAAVSGFSSGFVLRRFPTGPVVLLSCVLTASGLLISSQAPHFLALALATIPLGLGAGAVDAGLNGYVARHYSGRHMNWLHACWGIGATCGPLFMSAAIRAPEGWRTGYLVLGCVQLSLATVFLCTLRLWQHGPAASAPSTPSANSSTPTLTANSEAGWLSVVLFALYVAGEMTLGLWASTLMVERRGLSPSTAGLLTSGYFAAITVGRIGVGFVVDRWGNRRLIRLGWALALVGLVLFALATAPALLGLGLLLTGFGFAPIYPGLMHEVPRRFAPEAVFVVIGRQSGAAALGGAACPALAGWMAQNLALSWIHALVLVAIVALGFVLARLDRLTPTTRTN